MSPTAFPTGDPYWFDIEAGALATYRFAALTGLWVPDATTDVHLDDINANELADGSYNPADLLNGTITVDLANGYTIFDADDPDFGSPTGTEHAEHVALYADFGTGAGTAILMGEWAVDRITDGTSWMPRVNAQGLYRLQNP